VFGLAHENEDILTHVISFDEAMAGFAARRILGVTALIGLQALALRRDAYRRAASSS
jgi:hypothetical protein